MKRLNSKFISIPVISILLIAIIMMSACSGGTPTTTAATTTSNPAANQPVLKVGALLNLSSVEGVEMQKWLNLFAKQYNDAGGWKVGNTTYKVQPMVYDCGMGDSAKARAAVEKAVLQDGVKFIVATWNDVPSVSITVTEPNKVLWMGVDFTNSTVDPKLNYTIRGQGLYYAQALFYYVALDAVKKGYKKAIIIDPDTQQGKSGDKLAGASAAMAGLQVADPIDYESSTTDFGPIATKIMSSGADVVFLAYMGSDAIVNTIGALKDAGYKGWIYPGNQNPTILEQCIKKVGKEYMEGLECAFYDPHGLTQDPKIISLMDAYTKEYGTWHSEGCFWIGPWFFFENAVNKTQSVDVDTVVNYLKNSKEGVATLEGYSQLLARPDLGINDKTIDAAPGHYLGVIKDGAFAPQGVISVKDQYLVSVKVYGLVDVFQKYWDQYGKPTFPNQTSRIDYADLTK